MRPLREALFQNAVALSPATAFFFLPLTCGTVLRMRRTLALLFLSALLGRFGVSF